MPTNTQKQPLIATNADLSEDSVPELDGELGIPDELLASPANDPEDTRPLLYSKIAEMGLIRKLTDIALAQTRVPASLREDATQEIHLAWASYRADTSLKPGQIASYANRIAHHACLRVRRELGLPVRLPGSAFRRKPDGNTQVDLRRFGDPLSWDEITERVVGRQESLRDSDEGWEHLVSYDGSDPDRDLSHEDEQRVQAVYAQLTPRQQNILTALRQGYEFSELPDLLQLSASLVQREITALRRTFGLGRASS